MHQQLKTGEVSRKKQLLIPQEVEDMLEHAAVPVDEVVLLQCVQDYGDGPVEHLAQS